MHDLGDWDDAALLREGDRAAEAFAVFYRRHVEAILRFFAKRRVDVTDAGDLTAEVFAAALMARCRYREDIGAARAWLLGIAAHKLADRGRRWAREQSARQRLGLEAIELTERDIADYELLCADEATSALSELPAGQRELVHARVVEGRDYKTIARENGLSEATARQRVSRGLAALRGRLTEEQ
jgi:RNA polymerase sigma factor (sigma-70 family)